MPNDIIPTAGTLPAQAPNEAAALERHEAIIERGRKTFVEVGTALMAIRDGRSPSGKTSHLKQ